MSGDVRVALSTEPDYSVTFTDEVMALHRGVADALPAPVEHDDDMNYSSAQKLVVWLDRECHILRPRDSKAAYRLLYFVSSRGRFFTFITLGLTISTAGWDKNGVEKPRRYWSLVAKENLPDEIKSVQTRIASILKLHRYALLEDPVLSQKAKGHLTKLDGRPATVFEVLFSEVY
jgi:hypothetical protein